MIVEAILGLLICPGPAVAGAVFTLGAIAGYTLLTVPVAWKAFSAGG